MTSTGDGLPSSPEQRYFRAIEEAFLRLRGAPLTLSPADWRVARSWYGEGIPVDLVTATLEELFAERRERGTRGRVNSLRYCAPRIEGAWRELRELRGPERTAGQEAAGLPSLEERLAALARALPSSLPGETDWTARIRDLAGGSPAVVEEGLQKIEREILAAEERSLDAAARAEVDAAVEARVGRLRTRLPESELAGVADRLRIGALRERLGLPVLSLFAEG